METNENKVFGLNGVQLFFLSIFMIAILAYVMITIFGSLSSNSIIPQIGASNSTNFTYTTPTTFTAEEGITSSGVQVNQNGSHLNFDGGNDGVDVNAVSNVTFNGTGLANGFTISAWINPRSIGETNGRILDKSTGTNWDNGFGLYIGTGGERTAFKINTGTACASLVGSTPYGTWTHALVTVTSGQIANIYINGVQNGDVNRDLVQGIANITTTNAMRIGNRATATDRTFDGGIDEIRFYNRTLTTDEITQIYNSGRIANSSLPSEGLVLHYSFDEANGTIVYDKSGNGNHGQ